MRKAIVIIALTLTACSSARTQEIPQCWEDEVVIQVVHDPYDLIDAEFGCVPADNLPVSGYRP